MFLPLKLVIAGEDGKHSYFIKRAGYGRRALNRFMTHQGFMFWTVFALVFPFRVLWNFAGEKKERSILIATGLLASSVIFT